MTESEKPVGPPERLHGETLGARQINRAAKHQQGGKAGAAHLAEAVWRPTTRGQCENQMRPCPFVMCRHHLFVDERPNGGLKFPFGQKLNALDTMPYTCSLDACEQGGMTLEEVALATNITRERVRQVEVMALMKLRRKVHADKILLKRY
jgi:hypothetical protein